MHAQVAGGVDYVHLAGPIPAEAAAASVGQPRRQQQQQQQRQQVTAAAVAPAWTTVGRRQQGGAGFATLLEALNATDAQEKAPAA